MPEKGTGSGIFESVEAKGEPAIIITDSRGTVISVSATFETAAGYSRFEVIGKNVAELTNGMRDGRLYQAIAAVISRGDSGLGSWIPAEAVIEGRKVQIIPLSDPFGVISTFAAIRHAGTSSPPPHDGPEKSLRSEGISRLAAGIAHNFNRLFTAVVGQADILLARQDGSDGHRQAVEGIREAAEEAAGIIRSLRAFGRMQILEPETVNLKSVARRALDGIPARGAAGVELREDLAQDTGWLRVDPAQIEWILSVLVDNARRNMPAGGRITVATANVDLETSFVRRGVSVRRGRYVMLSVHDTGNTKETRTGPRVFEPFPDTIEDQLGLSLAAVYGTVKQSGGHIWVFSSPGKGNAFKIYFPRAEES